MSEQNWGAPAPSEYSRYPSEPPSDQPDSSDMYWSTIDKHYPLVMNDDPDTVSAAASAWWAVHSAYSTLADDIRTEGNALRTRWRSPTAQQEFLSKLGILSSTLDAWAAQALSNWSAMVNLASALRTAQADMEILWRDFDRDYRAKQDQDQTGFWGALNPAEIVRDIDDQLGGERTSEVVARFSNRSRAEVLDPLDVAYSDAWRKLDGAAVYSGPKDAIVPDLDAVRAALAGRMPGAAGAPGGRPPVAPNAARSGAPTAPKAPRPASPSAQTSSAHLAQAPAAPTTSATLVAPGPLRGVAPNGPGTPPASAPGGPASPATVATGFATGRSAAPPVAPTVPAALAGTARGAAASPSQTGPAGAAAGRGPAPAAPPMAAAGTPSGPAGAPVPPAPGAGRPTAPGTAGPAAGSRPGTAPPGTPALPGRTSPRAPAPAGSGPAPVLPGRGSGARPASRGPGGAAGVPVALRGRAGPKAGSPTVPGMPPAGRSVPRSLQGRAFGGPATSSETGPARRVPRLAEALRGRGAESPGAGSRNLEAARRALRGSVSGRAAGAGGAPSGTAARPTSSPDAPFREAAARIPAMVGDHELFETDQRRPDVLRAKEDPGPVKKAGPALGGEPNRR